MNRVAFAALLSYWRCHPVQLAALVVGLALATALWSGVQAINSEARASYAAAARAIGGDDRPTLFPIQGQSIPVETYVSLRRAGWLVSPVIEGRLEVGGERFRLIGVDLVTAPPPALDADALETDVDASDTLGTPGRLFAPRDLAGRLTQSDLPPVVVAPELPAGIVLADVGVVTRLLDREASLDRLIVLPDQPLGRPPLEEIAPELEQRAPGSQEEVARLTDSFHLNLTAFGFLSFAVGLFIVHGAIGLAFEERRSTFRTLRALGLPLKRLVSLLAVELFAFAILSGGLGMLLGSIIAAALLPDVAATLEGLYGATVDESLSLRPAWWAAGLAIAVVGTSLAGAGAMWKVANLPALAAAQPRAWARASERTLWLQAGAALALIAFSGALAIAGSGLVAGFTLLGSLLLACALLLPLWLSVCLHLGRQMASGPISEWFWADTLQQLPGLRLAMMALLLALATNIGVGTMVQSFRLTFTGWLDQRLAAELYVEAEDAQQAEDLVAWLQPRSEAVLPIWSSELRLFGAPARVYGVVDHQTYRENWPLLAFLPGVWDRVEAGEGVLINEQLSRRENLSPGDPIRIDLWETRVAGIYSDYGNPSGQVIVGINELTRFDNLDRRDFGIRTEAPAELERALREDFGLASDQIVDQDALKRMSQEIFERTFSVTAALSVLTLGIAAVAMLTSLLTLANLRLPQLAPVWALGLTRKRLGLLELARSLLLAVLTFAAAVPVGLLLAWVLLTVVNVEAFGWQLPMYVFPSDWLTLGALSLISVALAGLWPAIRIATRPAADLIKVFAHER
ncbi:MAG: ABC transporter permease [Pseudomonadota bacterium]